MLIGETFEVYERNSVLLFKVGAEGVRSPGLGPILNSILVGKIFRYLKYG